MTADPDVLMREAYARKIEEDVAQILNDLRAERDQLRAERDEARWVLRGFRTDARILWERVDKAEAERDRYRVALEAARDSFRAGSRWVATDIDIVLREEE